MKRLFFRPASVVAASLLLVLACAGCSAIKRGKVVNKGIDPAGTKMHPGPIYWAEVRGETNSGRITTSRIEFFEMDWRAIKKNDWIAPNSYGLPRFFERIHAYNEQQRSESGRFAAAAQDDAPPPKKKARARSRKIAAKKPAADSPAAPIEQVSVPSAPDSAAPQPTLAEREEKLRQVRERAIEDESVRAMKKKIHAARSDEEQARAWREYRSALRDKMHALDPSLGDLIDQKDGAPAP